MKSLNILASCLLLTAIALDLTGKSYCSRAARCIAQATTSDPAEKSLAKEDAYTAADFAGCFAAAGMICAGFGLVVWLTSVAEGKRFTPIPAALFLFYVGLFFILV